MVGDPPSERGGAPFGLPPCKSCIQRLSAWRVSGVRRPAPKGTEWSEGSLRSKRPKAVVSATIGRFTSVESGKSAFVRFPVESGAAPASAQSPLRMRQILKAVKGSADR